MNIPWISKETISAAAEKVLDDYVDMLGCPMTPPIPIEDIIERGLGLRLGYIDFKKEYGIGGILGATNVNKRLVCIDAGLMDDRANGRGAFTCAHEAGHWVLHRELVYSANRSVLGRHVILCRKMDSKKRLEWQADYFAASILMPENIVYDAWQTAIGSDPICIYNKTSTISGPLYMEPCVDNWSYIAAALCRTGGFKNVSRQAMIIRLQELGLVQNMSGHRMGWRNSA
jgi:Zn-dependent peptidase ImmA (M78 family)